MEERSLWGEKRAGCLCKGDVSTALNMTVNMSEAQTMGFFDRLRMTAGETRDARTRGFFDCAQNDRKKVLFLIKKNGDIWMLGKKTHIF